MTPTPDALVLGVGNLLLGDEGVGVHVANRLQSLVVDQPRVVVLDGGTLGLELLGPIEQASCLIVVDCLRSGRLAGTVTVLRDQAATDWETGRETAHDLGLPSVFALGRLRGWQPDRVAVVGVEPTSLEPGLSLSVDAERGAGEAVETVLRLLREWGLLVER